MTKELPPYTPRLRKVLALAAKEAKHMECLYVGTEHLLMGLLREGGGAAGEILKTFGVTLESVKKEMETQQIAQAKAEEEHAELIQKRQEAMSKLSEEDKSILGLNR